MKITAVEPIGITPALAEQLAADFAGKGHQFVCFPDRNENPEVLAERMADADIVIISNIKLSATILSKCPKLKLLAVAFTGLDHIDLDFCKSHHIEVVNASGYATVAVAELAIGLMLDVYRRITSLDADTRHLLNRRNFLGREISGKTVGIVGTGAIGRKTAELLQCFGCKILAWSRTRYAELESETFHYVDLDTLMRESDIISLHVPLTAETTHLISADKLVLCKPSAILINTARGNVVDMSALADCLKNHRLAGAGIDVFECEPPLPQDQVLLDAPNCVLVPHVGYATREAFDIRIGIMMDKINAFLQKLQ
ncbi:MAG: hydroxyacid dehydrogenase [Bacteroidales bacterium]|nr:hydroxyacid dehydrogenase [Bacteroidales bacterium]